MRSGLLEAIHTGIPAVAEDLHARGDPGANDPVGLYYYDLNGGDFQRHTLDYGPADQASGTGIYLWITDIDGNGWKDIVAPGKEGMYLFKNMGNKK